MSSCPKCGKAKLPKQKSTGYKFCRHCGPILNPQQRLELTKMEINILAQRVCDKLNEHQSTAACHAN